MKYHTLPCSHCGAMVQRAVHVKAASCFTCKEKRSAMYDRRKKLNARIQRNLIILFTKKETVRYEDLPEKLKRVLAKRR